MNDWWRTAATILDRAGAHTLASGTPGGRHRGHHGPVPARLLMGLLSRKKHRVVRRPPRVVA